MIKTIKISTFADQQSDSGQLVQALRQLVPEQVPLATEDGVVRWSLGVS